MPVFIDIFVGQNECDVNRSLSIKQRQKLIVSGLKPEEVGSDWAPVEINYAEGYFLQWNKTCGRITECGIIVLFTRLYIFG